MMHLAEYRRRAAFLSDYLPWAALIAPGVILNKDGAFQRTAKFRGPDLDSSVPSELAAISQRLSSAFRRLGERWTLFIEAQRLPAQTYPNSSFTDPASALIDAERRADFEADGSHFESAYFLTFAYLPPEDTTAASENWLFEGTGTSRRQAWDLVDTFRDQSDRILNQIEGFMSDCRWLDDTETLTYLHSTISTRRHTVAVPDTPMHLDALLADEALTGGLSPMLGRAHLRVLTISGFPAVTIPGILDDLNRLGFAYRWSTRAMLMDKGRAQSVLGKIRRQWFAKRKSLGAILKEVMTNEQAVLVDNDAANKAADADAALQDLGADYAGYAWITATLVVWDEHADTADDKRVHDAIAKGAIGKIAVTYFEWAGGHFQHVVKPWTIIDTPQSAIAFAEELGEAQTRRGRRTSISAAIDLGVQLIEQANVVPLRKVIDISGDGANNDGRPVTIARDEAAAKGIAINGLPVMLKQASYFDLDNLDLYYKDCVVTGPGAFVIPIRERHQFVDATRTKLIREIAELPREGDAVVQKAQSTGTNASCMSGERQWRDRMGN
ncbi:MAG: hypothetical protein B7Z14_03280 [Bosea sp. 32-68-6]|nr:MAG: hypothetical protein B7Z14_03280 [Bosea sp. 32-68-6]